MSISYLIKVLLKFFISKVDAKLLKTEKQMKKN